MVITETERLYLREMTTADAESLFMLNSDPLVLQYTGNEPFKSVAEAKAFVAQYDHYAKYGYGRWAMIEKNTKVFIGWCGLKHTPELKETDIGFRLHRKYWNKGYATEAAAASIQLGFEKFGMEMIVGRAMKANPASIKVLEKLGLKYWKDFQFDDQPGVICKIDRPGST